MLKISHFEMSTVKTCHISKALCNIYKQIKNSKATLTRNVSCKNFSLMVTSLCSFLVYLSLLSYRKDMAVYQKEILFEMFTSKIKRDDFFLNVCFCYRLCWQKKKCKSQSDRSDLTKNM